MGLISTDQSYQVIATLLANTDWNKLDFNLNALQELVVRSPKEAGRHFTAFLKNGGRMNFPVWKIIQLGKNHNTVNDYLRLIRDNSSGTAEILDFMLNHDSFTIEDTPTYVNLVLLSVADLGFPHGAKYEEVCERAFKYGLELCPAEVGPQYVLQYGNQIENDDFSIAMEPIHDTIISYLFSISFEDNIPRLTWNNGHKNCNYNAKSKLAFVSRKKLVLS